ncbi:hypothetical protein HMPREF9630_01929 [Peptoanaerobacter stomatis]|uniref:FlgN protein n=1 Tax=Peptoanaerobacter stomatis TaxID=796937 RepID=V9HUJ9_9FIRM|nr:hypothetical protein [Peptoanaerobacter stomatis]EHL16211.1 hypothetical protein HMPREF9630_01929 [Peptoanaerobacter stomatis]
MNDYEKLVSITKNKHTLSNEFLEIVKKMQKDVSQENFESIEVHLIKRQEIIDSVNLLDKQFLTLFEGLKKNDDFEQSIINYPELKEYISDIKANFELSYDIDEKIMPIIRNEIAKTQKEIKKIKTQEKVVDKYSQDVMKKITGANFGVFIDEMK